MVFETASDQPHAVGEQRGGQRVAGVALVRAAVESEIERLAAVDAAAERQPVSLFAHKSAGGSPILYAALISCVTLSRATLNQRRQPYA